MPTRSITVLEARVHPFRRTDDLVNLSEIGQGKQSLLVLFHGCLKALDDDRDRLRDDRKQHYIRITKIEPSSQRVLVVGEPGYFGGGGSTWNVTTHQQTRKHETEDAPGTPVRLMMVVAPNATVGHVFVERAAGADVAHVLLDKFSVAFKQQLGLNIKLDPVLEGEAWIAAADVEKVEVVDPRYTTDIGDPASAGTTKVVGRVSHTLLPPRGVKYLPRAVYQHLQDGTVSVSQLVNLRFLGGQEDDADQVNSNSTPAHGVGAIDDQEIRVTMSKDGGPSKTFLVDNPRRPRVLYPVGDDSASGSDGTFRRRCFELLPDFLADGQQWDDAWQQDATWEHAALDYRMELPAHDHQ